MGARSEPAFGGFPREWVQAQRVRLRASTWQSYEAVVRLYLVPEFGPMALPDITTRRVNRLYARLLQGGGARKPDCLSTASATSMSCSPACSTPRRSRG